METFLRSLRMLDPFVIFKLHEQGVLPVKLGEAIVECAKQHEETDVISDESSKDEAASLLINMAKHYK